MSIAAERKTVLIGEYATNQGDTGSPEVQVAVRGHGRRTACHDARVRGLLPHSPATAAP